MRNATPTQLCRTCGQSKPRSEFSSKQAKRCAACKELPPPRKRAAGQPRACFRCFEVKPAEAFAWGDGSRRTAGSSRRRRKTTCLVCEAEVQAEREHRFLQWRATWKEAGRRVRRCSKCGEVKELETSYYTNGRRKDGSQVYRHYCKTCDVSRITARVKSMLNDPATAPDLRAQKAAWQRSWRERHPERYREGRRRAARALKHDPQRHARYLETARIAHRLRLEKRGGSLDGIRAPRLRGPVPPDKMPALPAAPLAEALTDYAETFNLTLEEVSAAANVDSRQLRAWSAGQWDSVQFDVADRALTSLGLAWWEVWDQDVIAA